MTILDPAFEARQAATMPVLMGGIAEVVAAEEPSLREGMAEAYAARFSLKELADIEAFFATPSGAAYAGSMMALSTDPAIMARAQAMVPKMTAAMPALIAKASAAAAGLPPPRRYEQLTDAERAELARLLGVEMPAPPANKDPRT